MPTRQPSTVAIRIGTITFFFAGLVLLFDRNWAAWLDLTAVSVAIVFVSSTLNFLLSGCFIPGCRS